MTDEGLTFLKISYATTGSPELCYQPTRLADVATPLSWHHGRANALCEASESEGKTNEIHIQTLTLFSQT